MRNIRKRNASAMRLTQNQNEEVKSYQESNLALRKELENLKDVENKNTVLMKNSQMMPCLKKI